MQYSPNTITIRLSALGHNLNQVRTLIDSETQVMGMVKSDAYGHGLVPVSQYLEKRGIDALGVAHLYEALELRDNGIKLPIVLFCGLQSREEAEVAIDKGITPLVFDMDSVELLAEEAGRKNKKINIQVKIDTGMGRLGIPHQDIGPFLKNLSTYNNLYLEGLASHLSSADETDPSFTKAQIAHFKKAVDSGRSMGLDLPLNNLANSAGIMAHKDSHFNMVRPGVMLYGGLPSPEFRPPLQLESVMTLKGLILQIRDLPDNTPVSYGRTYYTKGPQRLAVTSAGYGDGLFRWLSNKGSALIKGERVNIVGRVCMNLIVCDITPLKNVRPGDEVIFLGAQGESRITGDDMARWADTISYEVFCSIGQKASKEYTK